MVPSRSEPSTAAAVAAAKVESADRTVARIVSLPVGVAERPLTLASPGGSGLVGPSAGTHAHPAVLTRAPRVLRLGYLEPDECEVAAAPREYHQVPDLVVPEARPGTGRDARARR